MSGTNIFGGDPGRYVGGETPTRDDHLATKKYVDDNAGGLDVTDGTRTVTSATELDFTSGATVTDAGGGVAQVAVSGGSLPVSGFAVHTQSSSEVNNGSTWIPTTLDFLSDDWTFDLEAGEGVVGAGAFGLYLIQAQLVYHILSGGPADNVWGDIVIGNTAWNVDPLSFDCVDSPGGIGSDWWRGSIAAAVPLSDGCDISMQISRHPFSGLTAEVGAQSFLRVIKIGDDASFA